MTETTRDLVSAFTRRLATAGCPDTEALARELVVIAAGHGWRHIPAAEPPPDGPPATRDVAAERAAAIRRQLRGGTP